MINLKKQYKYIGNNMIKKIKTKEDSIETHFIPELKNHQKFLNTQTKKAKTLRFNY